MTKALTKGEKARRKRGRPRIEDAPRDPRTGLILRGSAEKREAAQRTVALARCKLMGWQIDPVKPDPAIIRKALAEHMCCTAGRAIDADPERDKLWQAIKTVLAVYTRYWTAIGAPPPYAKAAMLEHLPEALGTDGVEASTWDDRSEEERAKAATSAMMRIEGLLGMAGQGVSAEVKHVLLKDEAVRDYARLRAGLLAVSQ